MIKVKRSKFGMVIGIFIIVLCILFVIFTSNKNRVSIIQDNKIFANTSEGIIKEEEYDGIKFSNISMLTKDDKTTFTADVTNVSNSEITKEKLHVVLKNGDGKEVIKFLAYFPGGLKKNETKTITAFADGSFKEAEVKEITD